MDFIRVEVIPRRELFRDEESGFKIYSLDIKSSDGEIKTNEYGNISLKGSNLPDFNIGSVYDLEIVEEVDSKYKGSYAMVRSHFVKPQEPDEQWKFLSMIVTEGQYMSISQVYSEDFDNIIDIIINDEFDYSKVSGYGEIMAHMLKKKVENDLYISEALAHFSEYDISYNIIKKMVSIYGTSEKAIKKIEENPYAIIDESGFGFIKADDLAMKLGIEPESRNRVEASLNYMLSVIRQSGDIWILRKKLYNKMKKLLKIDKEHIEAVLDNPNEDVFVYNDRFASAKSAKDEMGLAYTIIKRSRRFNNKLKERGYDPEKFIESFESRNSLTLSDRQREFLHQIDKSNILFLIGNAGTGKSLIQKVVIDVAETVGLSYTLLAPTGKASRVLKEYTGREAHTIHKKIGFGSPVEPLPIASDIVLVDEASMCDVNIANKLMNLVSDESLVVFIGDDAQIPSVGEGNFLFDCIHFDGIPKVRLDKVFRQKESGMLDAITMTRKGEAFLNTHTVKNQTLGNNFQFRHMMKHQIPKSLLESYEKMIKSGYSYDEIGVLVPTNIGEIGTIEMNTLIQELVNPQTAIEVKEEYTFGSGKTAKTLRVGDYVMNTENMYDAQVVNRAEKVNIFNGECGEVISVNLGNKEVIVDIDGSHVLYPFSDAIKKLNHAWAITIHKSQGSQYKVVLVVVDSSATYQLNANLLYTAMSRAQNFLGVFGQAETYNKALRKFENFKRNSFLNEFLKFIDENSEILDMSGDFESESVFKKLNNLL